MRAQHPKMVIFDALTCCSFRRAYHNPRHSSVLHALGELLGSAHLADVFGGIFDRTVRLGFIPNAEAALFYGKLARTEIQELSNRTVELLPCGHTPNEHESALKTVSSTFPEIRLN